MSRTFRREIFVKFVLTHTLDGLREELSLHGRGTFRTENFARGSFITLFDTSVSWMVVVRRVAEVVLDLISISKKKSIITIGWLAI